MAGAFALANLKKLIPLMEEKSVEVCNTFDSEVNYSQGIINRTSITSVHIPFPLSQTSTTLPTTPFRN